MPSRRLAAIMSCAVLLALPASAQTRANTDEVLKAEQQRVEYLTSGRLDELAGMLSPTLTYTHSSATLDSKEQFLESLRSGRVTYRSMSHRNVEARMVTPDVAVLTGESDVVIFSGGKEQSIPLRFTIVYARRDGRWTFEAWQSTRRP